MARDTATDDKGKGAADAAEDVLAATSAAEKRPATEDSDAADKRSKKSKKKLKKKDKEDDAIEDQSGKTTSVDAGNDQASSSAAKTVHTPARSPLPTHSRQDSSQANGKVTPSAPSRFTRSTPGQSAGGSSDRLKTNSAHASGVSTLMANQEGSRDQSKGKQTPGTAATEDSNQKAALPGNVDAINPDGRLGSMITCLVCICVPESKIYQCSNGHLLCEEDHARIIKGDTATCPTCRVKMSRMNPTRNIVAEAARDQLPRVCENANCRQTLTYRTIKQHQDQECPWRTGHCQYLLLGCDWHGLVTDRPGHEAECAIKTKTGVELIEMVSALDAAKEQQKQHEIEKAKAPAQVLGLLSSRCRNIDVRDVRLEYDDIVKDISSTPFFAVGEMWVATLRKKKDENKEIKSVGIVLTRQRNRDRPSRFKLPCEIGILRGPSLTLDIDLPPSTHLCNMRRGESRTPFMRLPLSATDAKRLAECHEIHIRIVFADRRNGLYTNFTTQRDAGSVRGGLHDTHHGMDSATDDDDEDVSGAEDDQYIHHHHHGHGDYDDDEYEDMEMHYDSDYEDDTYETFDDYSDDEEYTEYDSDGRPYSSY